MTDAQKQRAIAEHEAMLTNKQEEVSQSFRADPDCALAGPDVGCDGVCFSDLANDDCGVCDGDGSSCVGCMDSGATNYNPDATTQSYNEFGTSTCTYASCSDIPTDTGCLWADGTSGEWWEGWWNCAGDGVEVCGLAEVVFELNLPDGVTGTPHVQGTYNGWCGECYNAMGDDDGDGTWTHTQYFTPGEYHDYKYSTDGWSNQEDLTGLDCATEADGFWNRNFTAGEANTSQTLTHCWGTCEESCPVGPTCGDGTCDADEDCSSCASDCGACPTYDVVFDVDGVDDCGFVSVTGTWDNWSGWGAHTDNGMTANMGDGSYEYVILCVNTEGEWWNDIWSNSTVFNAPAECDVTGEWGNYGFSVNGTDTTVSICAGTCDAVCAPTCTYDGDANGDGVTNVIDVTLIVASILGNAEPADPCSSDLNGDGVVTVTDIVLMVTNILAGNARADIHNADESTIILTNDSISLKSNGYVGGVQMTINHGNDFAIELADAFVADYRTNDNQTTLIVIADGMNSIEDIASISGNCEIESAILVASDGTEIDGQTIVELRKVELQLAGPNPFNPTTSLNVVVPQAGHVSVKVYNVLGQEVATLADGFMGVNPDGHRLTWNASLMPSGVYLVRAETVAGVSTQKLMLLK